MGILLDGKSLAQQERQHVMEKIKSCKTQPKLAVILVGTDPASHTYVHLKQLACQEVGIGFELFAYPTFVSEQELMDRIQRLNARSDITGILVQLPLPGQNPNPLITAIDPKKDVDGFHPENLERLRQGKPTLAPAVALGILKLIEATHLDLPKKHAVIIGSHLFGEPLAHLLSTYGIESFVISASDSDLSQKTITADILISAVGHPGLITKEMVKAGAVVIDVGTTKVEQKIVGDVMPDVLEVAGWMTPVPGGVGPMTVALLLINVLAAYQQQKISE